MEGKERARLIAELADLKLDIVPHPRNAIEIHWSVVLLGKPMHLYINLNAMLGLKATTQSTLLKAHGERWLNFPPS